MNSHLQKLVVFAVVGCFAQGAFAQESQQMALTLQKVKFGSEVTQTIAVPYTENVTQTFQIQVPFTEIVEQSYQVQVPYADQVKQVYTVQVPYVETVTADDGTKKEVPKMRTEERERTVTVNRVRVETRVRNVPVTRMRTEQRKRVVPVTSVRQESTTIQFPPKGAVFQLVSGAKLSDEDVKAKTAESITILVLPHGSKLNGLHRSVLKPDLIVMTLPKTKTAHAEKPAEKESGEL